MALLSGFLLLALFQWSMTQAVVLPQPGGPFSVTYKTLQLVDENRQDPYNKTHLRKIMVSRFDPVERRACQETETVPYMPPTIATAEDAILEPYGWPPGVLGSVAMSFCAKHRPTLVKPQTVLFSPGLNTSRHFYSALAAEVASKGYTVLTIDHPYDTDIVEFPDGSIIYGGRVNTSDENSLANALGYRLNDVSFVLNTIGIQYDSGPKAVMFGHSFGGAATATSMVNDTRIRGGVNLDGTMFGGAVNAGLDRPGINQTFVLWGSTGHSSATDSSWNKFWTVLRGQKVWKRELSVKNSSHGSYWDLPLIADITGIRKQLPREAELALTGTFPGQRMLTILREYLDDYFQFALTEGAGEGLLSGPSPMYAEVEFVS